jgi:hypothetical protein
MFFGAGFVALQIFLSLREPRWPGLVLPILSFCVSLLGLFGVANFGDSAALAVTAVTVFLLYNIPTVLLLAVYFACRERQRRKRALERMQAQDLD